MKFTIHDLLSKIDIINTQVPQNIHTLSNCCFYGPTGSGKSSLICYVLEYSKVNASQKGSKYQLSHPTEAVMPIIGNKNYSETELPSCYKKKEINLIDLPGILDTKGSEQEIVNAYTNSIIFKQNRSFKFMIVLEASHFYDKKGSALVETISRLEKLIGSDFPNIFASCCLVVSKHNSLVYSEQDILSQINDINDSHSGLTAGTNAHNLVKTLLKNNQIVFFSVPKELTPQKMSSIEEKMIKTPAYIFKNDSKISLSEESKVYLSTQVSKEMEIVAENVIKLANKINVKYNTRYGTVNQAQLNFNLLSQAQSSQQQLNLKNIDFPIKQMVKKISSDLSEVNIIQKTVQRLKKISKIHSDACSSYCGQFVPLFTAIVNSKKFVQNEIQRINAELEKERIAKQNQARRQQAQRLRLLQIQKTEEANRKKIQDEKDRQARQLEIKQAEEKRIRDQQAQDLLNKQDAVAHAVNNPPVQHVYHSGGGGGGGGGCTIM